MLPESATFVCPGHHLCVLFDVQSAATHKLGRTFTTSGPSPFIAELGTLPPEAVEGRLREVWLLFHLLIRLPEVSRTPTVAAYFWLSPARALAVTRSQPKSYSPNALPVSLERAALKRAINALVAKGADTMTVPALAYLFRLIWMSDTCCEDAMLTYLESFIVPAMRARLGNPDAVWCLEDGLELINKFVWGCIVHDSSNPLMLTSMQLTFDLMKAYPTKPGTLAWCL